MSAATVVVAAALVLALVMAIAWAVVLRTGKSGWTDTFWSGAIGVVGAVAVLVPTAPGEPNSRSFLVAALVAVWSARLAIHIGGRTLRGGDDPRYAQLRQQWGRHYRSRLLLFLEIQAAVAAVLVVAVLVAGHNPAPLGLGDVAGVAIAAAAIVGETFADRQLAAFKADAGNSGMICDTGLWSLSRHPNYFFEWLHWLAYVPIGLSFSGNYPWGWITLAAPALMYWLLVHVSGVPPLEAHLRRTRGAAFENYRRRVRAFWPIPRRGTPR